MSLVAFKTFEDQHSQHINCLSALDVLDVGMNLIFYNSVSSFNWVLTALWIDETWWDFSNGTIRLNHRLLPTMLCVYTVCTSFVDICESKHQELYHSVSSSSIELVSKELLYFGEIAGIFQQIKCHSNRFVLWASIDF